MRSETHLFSEGLVNILEELLGASPGLSSWLSVTLNQDGKILGHFTSLNALNDCSLKVQSPLLKSLVFVDSTSVYLSGLSISKHHLLVLVHLRNGV